MSARPNLRGLGNTPRLIWSSCLRFEVIISIFFVNRLLKNAVRSAEDFAGIKENGSLLRIGVEDNGTGIPPGNLDKLFAPFHTTKEKGTGLGLSIVKKIAESHAGSVAAESPPAGEIKGSRFTIKIPIDRQGHIA